VKNPKEVKKMKKGKLTLGIVLGLLIIGFVVAQAQAVSAQDDSSVAVEPFTLRAGGVFCLNVGGCNDVKLAYQSVGDGIYSLTGYEYGCGHDCRLTFGSMHVVGSTLQIGYTTIYGISGPSPRIGQYNAQIDLVSLSGPYQYAWHYDGYHCGSGIATIGSCAASLVESDEFDESE
jgi:hypothetical protein